MRISTFNSRTESSLGAKNHRLLFVIMFSKIYKYAEYVKLCSKHHRIHLNDYNKGDGFEDKLYR